MKNPFSWFKKKTVEAADVPQAKPTRAPSSAQVVPYYLGSSSPGAKIANKSSDLTNIDLSNFARNSSTMAEVIKNLVLSSPDLSHSVETKIKTAISKRYTAIAYDAKGVIDPKGTELLQSFLLRLNYGAADYTKFSSSTDIRTLASTLLYDSFRYGGMCLELVLGSMRLPAYIQPVATRLIYWGDKTPAMFPIYRSRNGEIPLDFPTIFYSSTTPDPESAYSESPLQTAIQASLWDIEFVNDLRRAATKNMLQRLKITIKSDEYRKTLPMETQTNVDLLEKHMAATVSALETQMAALSPEDSLVLFDVIDATTIQDANRSEDRTMDVLHKLINGRISSGSKTLPSIIGRGESAGASSTESLLFLKAVASAQNEVNILLSRVFTFALKLFGFDSYAVFEFEEVNLRPGLELASFKAIEQSTVLEQLSFGFISDEEASIRLTGTLPGPQFKPLSGTQFKVQKANVSGNDYSNTSVATTSGKTNSTQSQKNSGDTTQKGVKSQ